MKISQLPLHNSSGVHIHQREGFTGKNGKPMFTKRGGRDWFAYEFNLALLAEQLWRLVQYPDSLVARVLRRRYYIMSSPLRTVSISSSSYVWTSISSARYLLLLGIRHKIYSGYEVKVWTTLGSLPHQLGQLVLLPQYCTRA